MSSDTLPERPDQPELREAHDRFEEFLRRRGLKYTTERREILKAILGQNDHFEVEELLINMRSANLRVSRATIYRAVELLCEAALLMRVELGKNQVRYEHIFKTEHPGFHHHLFCRETGEIAEFSSRELDELIRKICQERDFTPENMRLVVTGLSRAGREQRNRTATAGSVSARASPTATPSAPSPSDRPDNSRGRSSPDSADVSGD